MKVRDMLVLCTVLVMCIMVLAIVQGQPTGAGLTRGSSSNGTGQAVESQLAQGGNVTGLNIDQIRITDIWQGFYGNVTSTIVLENAAGNNFYDWDDTSISGEVFATRNTIGDWSVVNCTNSTQWAAEEAVLGISGSAVDGIDETFNNTNHPSFTVGDSTLTGCRSTQPYNSSEYLGSFYNVLINANAAPNQTIYTVLLNDDGDAFDGGTADFELLVPTNQSNSLNQVVYYFYGELS